MMSFVLSWTEVGKVCTSFVSNPHLSTMSVGQRMKSECMAIRNHTPDLQFISLMTKIYISA